MWHEAGGYCGAASRRVLKVLRTRVARVEFCLSMTRSCQSAPKFAVMHNTAPMW
jgi:hypothetical protein